MSGSATDTRLAQQGNTQPKAHKAPSILGRVFGALIFSLFISVVIEWVGLTFIWEDEAFTHGKDMVEQEYQYLNKDFTAGFMGTNPSQMISEIASKGYYYAFEFTYLEDGLTWLGEASGLDAYVLAIITCAQLFLIRLGILTFSLPIYLLSAMVGASTGLTMRDIRRWSGGREYGRIYHKAKAIGPKMLMAAWVIYLSLPISIHPNAIILPCALLFGVNILIITASFKKYL